MSPEELITFVSNGYPERSSDKTIFMQSKSIDKLDVDNAIIMDKGFLINDICIEKNQIIKTAFYECKTTIARTKVHVERSNQLLKVFKILSTLIPYNLLNQLIKYK